MHHFFVEPSQIEGSRVRITGQDVNHIRHVLRMKKGENLLISCGTDKEYLCRLDRLDQEREVLAEVIEVREPDRELSAKVVLFQCLPKSDKMELIIQKAVELGAFQIVPVVSRRCIVKLDEKKASAKKKRWDMIAQSAAKQSKRLMIPEVHMPVDFQKALQMSEQFDLCLLPYELEADTEQGMLVTKSVLSRIKKGQTIAVFIGPEGGFEKEEAEAACQSGYTAISLGGRILRTETAGLAALSILMYHIETLI